MHFVLQSAFIIYFAHVSSSFTAFASYFENCSCNFDLAFDGGEGMTNNLHKATKRTRLPDNRNTRVFVVIENNLRSFAFISCSRRSLPSSALLTPGSFSLHASITSPLRRTVSTFSLSRHTYNMRNKAQTPHPQDPTKEGRAAERPVLKVSSKDKQGWGWGVGGVAPGTDRTPHRSQHVMSNNTRSSL